MLVTFVLAALAAISPGFFGATAALAATDSPLSESGSIAMKPATNATLSAVLGTVPSGRELELSLTDAPPITVEFVRYDAKRELLVYRQPEVRGEFPSAVERERIDQLRFVETVKDDGDGVLGFMLGAAIGGAIGYKLGSDANTYRNSTLHADGAGDLGASG